MAISCAIGRRGRCTFVVCVALVTASLSVGCGKSRPEIKGKLPVFPVKGKVMMDGQPMAGATVLFYPTQEFPKGAAQQRPRAVVEDDGTFQVSTYGTNDGAPAGEYKVTVSWKGDTEGLTSEQLQELPEKAPETVQHSRSSKLRVEVKNGDNPLPTWDLTERQASNTP
ncbi:MAG TPA: hypothetical protein VHX68_02425 [Planctomycetaceae bacterium]|jgi:hypothetical protein|nr:hypothetical protein [Planctomycetaceae bacterium]